jgi:hypothetical protein
LGESGTDTTSQFLIHYIFNKHFTSNLVVISNNGKYSNPKARGVPMSEAELTNEQLLEWVKKPNNYLLDLNICHCCLLQQDLM